MAKNAIAKNTICLWYDNDTEDAARFYAATFPDSAVGAIYRAPSDFPSGKKGDVLTVEFTVVGIPCLGLNGGPAFRHNEAFSFQIATDNQEETDRYWNAIVGNGGVESQCDCLCPLQRRRVTRRGNLVAVERRCGSSQKAGLARAGSARPQRMTGDRSNLAFRRLQERLATLPPPTLGRMTAQEFILFESTLSPKGAHYTKLERFPLADAVS